jgi:DNA repair protein RecO (recombination protein O)
VAPFSRTSHVVQWLTPDHGRIATVVKGALRPKSVFLGQYDLFYTCEILFYASERNGLHILRECTPLAGRSGLRSDWRAAAFASYAADLVSRVAPERAPFSAGFTMMEAALDAAADNGARSELLFWFELRLLASQGVSPRLAGCRCGREAECDGGPRHFSASRGGVLCARCAAAVSGGTVTTGPDIPKLLQRWSDSATPAAALRTRCSSIQAGRAAELLGAFVTYHLDVAPEPRRIALRLMGNGQAS